MATKKKNTLIEELKKKLNLTKLLFGVTKETPSIKKTVPKEAKTVPQAVDLIGEISRSYPRFLEKTRLSSEGIEEYQPKIAEQKMFGSRPITSFKKDEDKISEWLLSKGVSPKVTGPIAKAGVLTFAGLEAADLITPGVPEGKIAKEAGEKAVTSIAKIDDPVLKIMKALKEVKPIRKSQEALQSAERSKRLGIGLEAWQKGEGEAGLKAALGQLKGKLPEVEYESLRGALSQDDITSLFNQVRDSDRIFGYEKFTAAGALRKLLGEAGTKIPTENELRLLNEVYGENFVQTVLNKRPLFQRLGSEVESAINIPRAIMASTDFSAPMRQGGFLLPSYPKQWVGSFKGMFKQAFSDKAFREVQEEIFSRPTYEAMRKNKLSLTKTGSNLLDKEEAFMTKFADKIPLIKASERAYVGFLNKLRADVFDDFVRVGKETGLAEDPKYLKSAAKFINAATGRGELGSLEKIAPELNALLWSPKLVSSRLSLMNPKFYTGLQPEVRKKALKSLFAFTGSIIGGLSLAKLAGAEVSGDPRNSDFGKIKMGNTRIDITGGFTQYIRLAAQLITGQTISSTTGKLTNVGEGYKPLTRADILGRGIEMKESPAASFAMMLLKNQDFMGQEPNIPAEIASRFIPMVVQDIDDLQKNNPNLLPLSVLPVFGIGVQTYGKQEPQISLNAIGEPQITPKPKPGLGEDIVSFLKGEKPIEAERPLPTGSASSWQRYLETLPKEQAAEEFDYIKQENPPLATRISKEIKYIQSGAAPEDIALKNLGVQNGERAAAIFKKIDKMDTQEEKATYYDLLKFIGVITPAVGKQISSLEEEK